MVGTVSYVTAANGLKPVLSHAEQGARKVPKKSQLVRSHATAGQRQALLVPADGEQLGQVKALEPQSQFVQGQAEVNSMPKSKSKSSG